ncbi:MAG: P-loop NTPase fold protein [Gallionella sp.]|nr:P-loop NTPase fold protein [Gallionella sp.]
MTETFKRVKASLVALLQDQDHKVIALTGKWGTGKTYLWEIVEKELFAQKKASEQPIYVSLFGVRTIGDFKLRILQNAYLRDAATAQKLLKTGGNFIAGMANKFFGVSAENSALIWLPQLTKGRLIVIDDLERKHKSLDIDEVLGFLDEYSETHKTRFLILLNTDKLQENKAIWETLHEKVIDAEVVLDPSAGESFDIAAEGNSSPYLAEARKAVEILGIRNIRVIKRILRAMKRIADATVDFPSVSTSRWVASTTLLTACHYRAVENPPPFEYLKSFNQLWHLLGDRTIKRADNELEWDLFLKKLGISSAGAYEEIMQSFLQTGLLDTEKLKILFGEYQREEVNGELFTKTRAFSENVLWNAHLSNSVLIKNAREFLDSANTLNASTISNIVFKVEKLGDATLAQQLLDAWLKSVDTRPEYKQIDVRDFDSHQLLHPRVIAKLNAKRDEQCPPLTIIETTELYFQNNNGNERQEAALRNSTVQNYEDALKQLTGAEFKRFIMTNLNWENFLIDNENIKIGRKNFITACSNIYLTDKNSRLSQIIFRVFQERGLVEKLQAIKVEQTL